MLLSMSMGFPMDVLSLSVYKHGYSFTGGEKLAYTDTMHFKLEKVHSSELKKEAHSGCAHRSHCIEIRQLTMLRSRLHGLNST